MGMMFQGATKPPMPDTFGLPVYKITKTIEERVGDEVRILCGYEMFGQTVWAYIAILSARDLADCAGRCHEIATTPERQFAMNCG